MKALLNNQYVRLAIFFIFVITVALLIVHFGNENALSARRGY